MAGADCVRHQRADHRAAGADCGRRGEPAADDGCASEFTAKARVRESFAQFKPADEVSKPEAKPQPKRKIARHRAPAAPQVALIAQQPQRFGLFGNNFFANNAW